MATKPTVVENINVLQVGKYGVRIDEKTWFGVNAPLTPSHFVPNEGYKVSVIVSKTGKKYIAEILGTEVKGSAPVAVAAAPAPVAVAAPVVNTTTTGSSAAVVTFAASAQKLDNKDIRIQRQGSYQAALHSPALAQWAVNIDEYLALVRRAANEAVKFINE